MSWFKRILTALICAGSLFLITYVFNSFASLEVANAIENESEEVSNDVIIYIEDQEVNLSTLDIELYDMGTDAERENLIEILAKTVSGEAGGVDSKTQQAAVIWCVLNQANAEYKQPTYNNIVKTCTRKNNFCGYNPNNKLKNWAVNLAEDVLSRWECEQKLGVTSGRVLPKEYRYFMGDGVRNYFCIKWHKGSLQYSKDNAWNWSLESPYED